MWMVIPDATVFSSTVFGNSFEAPVIRSMCHNFSSSQHAAAHFLFWQSQNNPLTGWWAHSQDFCFKFTSFWETLHVLSHVTYISHGFQVMVPPLTCVGPLCPFREAGAEGFCGRIKCCYWGFSCHWGRQNVCGRKEEMTLLCRWGTGLQHFADLLHPWQEASSEAVNWVQDVCVLLAQPCTQEQLSLQFSSSAALLALLQEDMQVTRCLIYALTALLLSCTYWHSGSMRKTSKYLRLGF